MHPLNALAGLRAYVLANPAPWVGLVSALFTGGIFGRIAYLRSIRPLLVFIYDETNGWRLNNIGSGPALELIVASADNDKKWSLPTLYYPMGKDGEVRLKGIQIAEYLAVKYTDIGGRWYSTECGYNRHRFVNHW